MELVSLSIPYEFIEGKARLSWREVLFGLDERLLDPGAPAYLAAAQIAGDEVSAPPLVDLAGSEEAHETRSRVQALASAEPEGDVEEIRRKWLYLVLAWLFEHRGTLPDPLRCVEEVYGDFGYPERIACFVRYMPSDEPDLGSPALNEQRLLDKWKRYLELESSRYAPS
ncbi:DUF2247 family protein [Sorangium sp. So ce1097]|uniref:DUF2247 family protein n=1 Tax=Sorangium sp. So ce1097 TaxID=3133330 RepID=UPI003F6137AD